MKKNTKKLEIETDKFELRKIKLKKGLLSP